MKTRIKSNYFSLIFILIMAILNFIFNRDIWNRSLDKSIIHLSFLVAPILIMYLLKKYMPMEREKIPSNFKFILLSGFTILIQELVMLFIKNYNIKVDNIGRFIIILILLISVILPYIYLRFKFKVEKISFKLNLRTFGIAFLIGGIYLSLTRIQSTINGEINIFKMTINFFALIIYPSLYEELIYRGFLISGIKKLKLKDNIINIIQAFIFGILHYNLFTQYGYIGIIGTSNQILVGYLIGQVYFYTGSLVPCIIIHAFFDLMFL